MLGFKNVVSIDIGSSLIKLVQLSESRGKIRLDKVGIVDNPVSNFRPHSQKISKGAVAQAIKHLLRKSHIKAKDTVSSLNGPSIIIQYLKFPPLSGKELKSAVNLEIQRVMPGRLNEVETDFQVLPQSEEKDGKQNILFVAVPKLMVRQRMETLGQAGLNPIAIDTDCLVLANCFLRLKNLAPQEDVMVLNLGTRLINLVILGKESLYFIRDISLSLESPLDLKDKAVLGRIIEEIRRSIHYHEERGRKNRVGRIFLTGGNAVRLESSDSFLKVLGLPVEKWNPLEDIEFDPSKLGSGFTESKGYLLAIGIGLGLREKQK